MPLQFPSTKNHSNLGVASVAGSDAHYGPEIGYAYTIVDAELALEEIIKEIKKGLCQPFGRAIPLSLRLKREILVFKRRLAINIDVQYAPRA